MRCYASDIFTRARAAKDAGRKDFSTAPESDRGGGFAEACDLSATGIGSPAIALTQIAARRLSRTRVCASARGLAAERCCRAEDFAAGVRKGGRGFRSFGGDRRSNLNMVSFAAFARAPKISRKVRNGKKPR